MGLIQPQNDYPEIIQFFKMLTLPKALVGYNREHVIDALRCLDAVSYTHLIPFMPSIRISRKIISG